jgi:hypothetical protein
MGTDKLVFAVERCDGATGSQVTGSDISHVTGSDVSHMPCQEVCCAHAQPEVALYPP